jgi:hypothetical protein
MELESEPRSSRRVEYKDGMLDDPDRAAEIAKFHCIVNDEIRDVVAYNDIVVTSSKMTHGTGMEFREILGHKRVQPSDPDYMGSMYNTQLLWETGEIGWEPLHTKTRPACTTPTVTVAIYAEKRTRHSRLETSGLKKRAKTQKRLIRCANQQLHSFRTRPYTCTVQGSRDYEQAVSIDEDNKNTKWQDSTTKEFREIDE